MSDFDDASLVMIPSGYKNGKVYSVKPTDGTGDLTFTRASSATRVASNGLIEKVRTNLFTYSEQFDNAAWTKADTTIVANAVANPLNGAVTADKITDSSTATAARYFFQSPASSGTIYTSSGYFKKAEYNFVTLHAFGLNGALFNLDTGVKVSQSGGVGTITSVGDGWYRCTFSFTAGGSSVFFSQSPAGNITYTGTTGSGIFAFGCQLETGDIATDYIPTTTAGVSVGPVSGLPRLDYLNSTCPKLLLEPQRTNLVTFSENFDNAAWTKSNSVVTANTSVSPDGYTNADTIVISATGYILQSFASYSAVSGQKITISVFAKNQTNGFLTFGGATPAGTDVYAIESYGNGWYRHCVVRTFTTTTTGTVQYIIGTVGTHIIWGAQVEGSNSAYATSYIPTLAASVTRVVDAMSKSSYSCGITTEATLFADFEYQNTGSGYSTQFIIYNISAGDYIYLTVINNSIRAICVSAGVTQSNITSSSTTAGTRYKVAARFKQNDFALYVNGTLVGTDTSGTMPTFGTSGVTSFIGNDASSTEPAGYANQYIVFPTALSNSNLAALTA